MSSDTPAPAPGTVIDGKYRVERVLGQGGMGVVIEASHVVLEKRVAVKLLRPQVDGGQARERFAREARIAAQLPGEHVASVSDYGETAGGEAYLVMELLDGRDLERELAQRRRLPPAEAVDLILQACEGVAEAHAAGLVHRDLKPANLFLTRRRDGTLLVKVLDFGLSKVPSEHSSRLTVTSSSFGTPQYMSPEQIRSAKYVDARTDQHALGMVLYEALTGRPPYVAESVTALMVEISMREPAPMADVPPGLEAVVRRALAKAADARFPDVGELAAALAPFGGAGATASAARVAGAFQRGGGSGGGETAARSAALDTTQLAVAGAARGGGGARAVWVGAALGVVLVGGAAFGLRSFVTGGTARGVVGAAGASSGLPAASSAPPGPSAAPEPVASASPAPAAPTSEPSAATTPGPSAAPSARAPSAAGKAPRPRRQGAKPVDQDSDIFGQRRK